MIASMLSCALGYMLMGSAPAQAMGEADRLDFGVLTLGGQALGTDEITALERVSWELEKRTSVAASPHPVALAPLDPALRRHPLLFLHGRGGLPPLAERVLDALRGHLESGGLLFIDETDAPEGGQADDPFDRDVRALARRLFPRAELAKVPADHVLYKTFYLVGVPVGRLTRASYLEAVILDGRIVLLYSRNDVLGALARDRLGAAAHATSSGGDAQREQALRLAMNVVMYALCLDYKADQVHVPFLLKRRRGGDVGEPFSR